MEQQTYYSRIGGDEGVRQLVDRFYHRMDTLPEAAPIRAMHTESMDVINEKMRLFLTGWFGGPQLYVEQYGHPRLRARHLPFAIDTAARDQWMLCMSLALEDTVEDATLRGDIERALSRVADHMRNQPE